jgi:DNA-binding FadR family transcriptional regulator
MAELAAIYAREEDIARIRRCIRMIERAIPSGEAIRGGIDFHQMVADATHNPILAEIESRVLAVIRGHIFDIFSEPSSFKYDVESHERILQCIEAGDRAAARREAYEHIRKFAAELGIDIGWSPDLWETEGS